MVARTTRGPFCENCWERAPEAAKQCKGCGTIEKLFHYDLCRRCAGERHLRKLLTSPDGTIRPELDKVVSALLDFNPRRTLLYLRESSTANRLVADLASGACELSHEGLDAHIAGQRDLAVDYFRAVLVSVGVLPSRDEYLARLERWIEKKIGTIDDLEDRKLMAAFARWDLIARIRRRTRGKAIAAHTADIAQTRVAKAIAFLKWIKDQGETLATCQQAHIDLWLTSEDHQGPYNAQPFVAWAVRSKNASQISIPARPRRAFPRPLDANARWDIARQLLNDDSIETKDRVAGLMVLLYGQTPARTCRLTTEHVTQDENGVSLQLYKIPLRVPPPLDDLILQLVDIANDQHTATSNELNKPWLFPTQRPGQHLTSKRLNARLRRIGLPPESGRCAALLDICTTMPPAILERLLGVSAPAAERWSAGAVRTAYAAEVAGRSPLS
ncbi:zinc ribbon domain-containing protein [Streptomyces sp. NPDC093510]|uniref:zinc ribbon domain-containing protein n=1 Tax=Streptomyces sp. NPDC093510 TaxID=3155199 RepID=UPI003446EA46